MQKRKTKTTVPRVLAMHDLSCIGRCALCMVMPVLSVMGAQVIPLPTALLSTQTDGYADYYVRDLSPDLAAIADRFAALSLRPQAVYSGFAAGAAQCALLCGVFDRFGRDALKLVDPVLGDDGKLYPSCTQDLAAEMRILATRADVLTPNLTEACLLCDIPFEDTAEMSAAAVKDYIGRLLGALCAFGAPRVTVTGISTEGGSRICTAGLDRTLCPSDRTPFYVSHPRIDGSYPGTGDLFASVLLGGLLGGDAFSSAVSAASNFVYEVIADTAARGGDRREGICIEPFLPRLGALKAHTGKKDSDI